DGYSRHGLEGDVFELHPGGEEWMSHSSHLSFRFRRSVRRMRTSARRSPQPRRWSLLGLVGGILLLGWSGSLLLSPPATIDSQTSANKPSKDANPSHEAS